VECLLLKFTSGIFPIEAHRTAEDKGIAR